MPEPSDRQYQRLLAECEYDPHRHQTTDEWRVAVWGLREYLYYAAQKEGRPGENPDGQSAEREASGAR